MERPRHFRAAKLTARGYNSAALAEYRIVLNKDPRDAPALIAVIQDGRERHALSEVIGTAHRALARDPGNFVALDGLAWAHVEEGNQEAAKDVIGRALKALDDLDTDAAFKETAPRLTIWLARVVLRLPGLRSRFPRLPSAAEMQAESSAWKAEWRAWALNYLAGQGPTNTPETNPSA